MQKPTTKQSKGTDMFPSDYVSREVKASDEYTILWLRAIESQISAGNVEVGSQRKQQLADSLRFYHGNQGTERYMRDFGLKDDEAGNMVAFSDLDWTPIGFMRVFIKSVYAYMSKETYDYEARGLDENSIKEKERMLFRKRMLMKEKDFFERIMGRPLTEHIPASEAEYRMAVEEPEKSLIEIALEQHLQAVLRENRFDLRVEKNLITDLIYSGYYAVHPHYQANGRITTDWVDVNELFFPRSKERDFSDIPWQARVRMLTIRQIKGMVTDRTLDEEKWQEIAGQYQGTAWSGKSSGIFSSSANNVSPDTLPQHSTRYDHYVIPVIEAYRLSTEYSPYEKTQNPHNGEVILRSRPFDFKPGANGKRVDREWVNTYGVLAIVGSNHVFNVGPVKNLVRPRHDPSMPMLPFLITKLGTDSIGSTRSMVEVLKPIENFLQTSWMKLMNEAATAKPDITWLELDFIANGILKGVDAADIQEAIDAVYQTGNLVGSSNDGSFNPLRPSAQVAPAGKIAGGLGSAFSGYVQALQLGFMIMERVIGRSASQIGQTPHPDTGKGVMEQVAVSSNEMLQDMVDCYQLGIHNTVEYISEMIMRLNDYRNQDEEFGYRQVFSSLTNNIMNAAKGMHTRTMGIYLQKRMTADEVNSLLRDIQDMRNARAAQGRGGITEEEFLELKDLLRLNPRVARRRLKFRTTRRQAVEQAMAERNMQLSAQNIQAQEQAKAQAAAEKVTITETEKRKTMELLYQLMAKHETLLDQNKIKAEERKNEAVAKQSKQDFEEDLALQATDNSKDKLQDATSTNNVSSGKI